MTIEQKIFSNSTLSETLMSIKDWLKNNFIEDVTDVADITFYHDIDFDEWYATLYYYTDAPGFI